MDRNLAVVEPTPRAHGLRVLPPRALLLTCALCVAPGTGAAPMGVVTLVTVLGSTAAVGCGGRSDGAELAERLALHEEAIERFAAWALRTTRTITPRDRERIEETLFAPVRDDDRILIVRVERDGRVPIRATHPHEGELPVGLAWTTVRSPRLGIVSVARDPDAPEVLWARVEVGASDPPPLLLTLALRPLPPE